jgi:hypothetical protein
MREGVSRELWARKKVETSFDQLLKGISHGE